MSAPLVLVTRPDTVSAALTDRLAQAGLVPLALPVIDIVPDPARLDRLAGELAGCDWLVAVSPSAVSVCADVLQTLPPALKLAAVGAGTARALSALTGRPVLFPTHGNDSEALLACSELADLHDRRFLVVKGRGGRPLLTETLAARGARVVSIDAYERRPRPVDRAALAAALAAHPRAGAVVTSREIANALRDAVGEALWASLQSIVHIVPHERVADRLRQLGVHDVLTTSAGDDGIVAALIEWFATHD